ncbi:MAG TPA: hypothetical protein VIV65_10670, partial [Gemmatimonadaceae bacterium]
MTPLAWAVLLVVVAIAAAGVDLTIGFRQLARLADFPPRGESGAPLVSIVVAARDEERGVEAAARSLLAQRYSRLEII